ncbi:glycosyltransferase family 4 protein [Nodularia sphaerocarpa]|uniref:glycosyltransferase family 4 protein n=1 Tax=Nodularia sphaerocarpa TaxID=137816 RepID=UPI001EFADD28|nr:glycosyltransferase family 4 protein [Nodularia sphaerocarpa]MDB9374999.1 glycosyltransferase family 4 protein [Nodularia sphaerocarpa CS-585]MDB9378382.1 glycosyltransferase family 4 protein [Nodularia sphaerocarpa CS-585A2]ULP74207.1 D-inositol 3-phosphate glycosyltransferase [Nodularia sphaerocarpa UHCC 0038]
MLAVIETHPIQYRAPVYRNLSREFNIPITVIYGSDFSVVGYQDKEFGAKFAWDTDLLSGYSSKFLSHVKTGGAQSFEEVSAQGLAATLKEIQPKALLITGYNHRLYQGAFYQGWKLQIPILFRGETTDYAIKRNKIKCLVRDRTLSLLYNSCSKLLYIGQNSENHFQHLGFSEPKLVFSPYCVDTQPFKLEIADRKLLRNTTREQLNITDTQKVLLFSGKLSYRKGVDLILPAIEKLPQEIQKQLVVLFLGNGELKSQLEKQAQVLPDTKVHFLGFQNQTQLSDYYHAADILVLPSRYSETWGLVVNEALHHGLPCIVSQAVGSAPDLVKPGVTGNIFAPDSVESLAKTIQDSLCLCNNFEVQEQCKLQISDYSVAKAAAGIAKAYNLVS